MTFVTSACVASVFASALAQSDVNLVVSVDKKGNVTWSGTCEVDVTPADPSAAPIPQSKPDVEIAVQSGQHSIGVTCNTTEGPVRKVVEKKLTRDETVKVTLDPGFLLVKVVRFDSPVAAEVTFFDVAGNELARSKERAVTLLPAGKVRVLAKVNDSKSSRPILGNIETTVVAQKKSEVTVDTTDGELTLTISENGRKGGGVGWLRLPGDSTHLVELRAGEKASVPPGAYELVTQLEDAHDFSEVVTKGILIAPQKQVQRSVNHNTSSLVVDVLVDGKPPKETDKVVVELYAPGAAQPFNTVAPGDRLKLKPGKIDVGATRQEPLLDDGSTLSARRVVPVNGRVVFDLKAAHLDVTTTMGRKPRVLNVALRPPGNDESRTLAQAQSDATGKARFSLAAQQVVVNATLKAPQGDVTTSKNVTLKAGTNIGVTLDLNVGAATVQVFAKGVAVPAEVRYFLQAAKDVGAPSGEPTLSLPAGQEAILPPGRYAVVVKRKGKETTVEAVVVTAGGSVERTVEVAE